MYCSNCGKKLSEDDFFCSNCGTPVLRQNLFDDDNEENNEDSFDETRLFTAEELGQYLNDEAEVAENHVTSEPVSPTNNPQPFNNQVNNQISQDDQDVSLYNKLAQDDFMTEESVESNNNVTAPAEEAKVIKQSPDVKKTVSAAVGSVNSFIGNVKERYDGVKSDRKTKQKLKEEVVSEDGLETAETMKAAPSSGPTSFKKVVLPVIIIGLIIGLVIGLILVQPWNNNEEAEDTNGEIVASTVIVEE